MQWSERFWVFSKKLLRFALPILLVLVVILFVWDMAAWLLNWSKTNTSGELVPAVLSQKNNQTPTQMINAKSDCKATACESVYVNKPEKAIAYKTSQRFQELIDAPVTPGTEVDLVERTQVLRDEFRYASEETKIKILQSLSVSLDQEFIVDALTYESATRVREAAAEALFFSSDAHAQTLLVDTLYDRDEILVATVIKILHRFDDKNINQQIKDILITRQTGIIKSTLQQLGYPVD